MPKIKGVPKGYSAVTTYFAVKGADRLLVFMKKAFGAKLLSKHLHDDGRIMHAEAMIGDVRLMLGDPGDRPPMTAMLYMFVADCDATYKKALKAGAKSVLKPVDQFYGDRTAAVRDLAGNIWWIAMRKVAAKRVVKAKRG